METNKDILKKIHPKIKDCIEDILWHGFNYSVVVIDGKQEFVYNQTYGITVRVRPTPKRY